MKKSVLFSIVFIGLSVCLSSGVNAQGVGINASGNPPDPSAILDASSTTKGTLITRMTTAQRDAINSPAEGLQIFNITTKCFEFYANSIWQTMFCSCISPSAPSAGTQTSTSTQIVWNWNAVGGATGYKYSTVNSYSTAADNGANISYTQTGLTCNTVYTLYVWAYNGACYSLATTLTQTTSACFTCGISTITDADGNTYNTVLIGSQCWMKENLKTTKYRDGVSIPNVTTNGTWTGLTTGAYCDYANTPSNSTIYGRLYNWYAATDGHNICPTAWHLPTDAEWCTLSVYLDAAANCSNVTESSIAGGKMKEAGTSHWITPNVGATNSSGFTGLPVGFRLTDGTFTSLGNFIYLWAATAFDATNAWSRNLNYNDQGIDGTSNNKKFGFSVRCLHD